MYITHFKRGNVRTIEITLIDSLPCDSMGAGSSVFVSLVSARLGAIRTYHDLRDKLPVTLIHIIRFLTLSYLTVQIV